MLLSVRKITAQHLRPISVNSHLDMGERGTKVIFRSSKNNREKTLDDELIYVRCHFMMGLFRY